jgi:hypothetical protein
MSLLQPLHGTYLLQPLDNVWLTLPLGLDDVPEKLKTLADELMGTDDSGPNSPIGYQYTAFELLCLSQEYKV